jgi:hypothetical protein
LNPAVGPDGIAGVLGELLPTTLRMLSPVLLVQKPPEKAKGPFVVEALNITLSPDVGLMAFMQASGHSITAVLVA